MEREPRYIIWKWFFIGGKFASWCAIHNDKTLPRWECIYFQRLKHMFHSINCQFDWHFCGHILIEMPTTYSKCVCSLWKIRRRNIIGTANHRSDCHKPSIAILCQTTWRLIKFGLFVYCVCMSRQIMPNSNIMLFFFGLSKFARRRKKRRKSVPWVKTAKVHTQKWYSHNSQQIPHKL